MTYFITTLGYSPIRFSLDPQTCKLVWKANWTTLSTYSTSHWGLQLNHLILNRVKEPFSNSYKKSRKNCLNRSNLTQSLRAGTSSMHIMPASSLNVKSIFYWSNKITTLMATFSGSTSMFQISKRTRFTSSKLVHLRKLSRNLKMVCCLGCAAWT